MTGVCVKDSNIKSHLRFFFVPLISLHQYTFLCVCVCVFLSLCLSLFPVLCFKAEACVTHSTWHMKPLSCLEPGVREKEGERREERGMWMWGVDGWNEGDLSLPLSLPLCLTLHPCSIKSLKKKKMMS